MINIIKAVIFDLDGTLLDRDQSVIQFIDNQYQRYHERLNHIPKDTYIRRFIELDARGYVSKEKVYQTLVKEFKITNLTCEALLQDYRTQFKHHCMPFPNLHSVLEGLHNKNLRLGLISNGKGQFQMDNVEVLGIKEYFDTILISEWEGMKKPDPKIFQKALHQFNVQSNKSLFVGDHPEKDIQGAQNIGMISVWKRDDYWKNTKAEYIIENLQDLLSVLEELNKG